MKNKIFLSMLLSTLLLIALNGCNVNVSTGSNSGSSGGNGFSLGGTATPASNTGNTGTTSGETPNWGHPTKTSGCQVNGPMQDTACTPGAIFPNATKDQICVSGYSSSVRNVAVSEKDQAYAEYGVTHHYAGQYEVDHLVSLELGGSNDIANLWPEAASPTPGFHQKDIVENYLHDQVCNGSMSLHDAQVKIATNWLSVYNQMPNK